MTEAELKEFHQKQVESMTLLKEFMKAGFVLLPDHVELRARWSKLMHTLDYQPPEVHGHWWHEVAALCAAYEYKLPLALRKLFMMAANKVTKMRL